MFVGRNIIPDGNKRELKIGGANSPVCNAGYVDVHNQQKVLIPRVAENETILGKSSIGWLITFHPELAEGSLLEQGESII